MKERKWKNEEAVWRKKNNREKKEKDLNEGRKEWK